MPPELHQQMKMHSVATYTTINELVVSAIKMYLSENDNDVNVAPNSAPLDWYQSYLVALLLIAHIV